MLMNKQDQIEEVTCGFAGMVYSKYQSDRYGIEEIKNKYDPFEMMKLELIKDLIDSGILCNTIKIN